MFFLHTQWFTTWQSTVNDSEFSFKCPDFLNEKMKEPAEKRSPKEEEETEVTCYPYHGGAGGGAPIGYFAER